MFCRAFSKQLLHLSRHSVTRLTSVPRHLSLMATSASPLPVTILEPVTGPIVLPDVAACPEPGIDKPSSSAEDATPASSSITSRKRPLGPDLTVPFRRKRQATSEEVTELIIPPDAEYYFENGLRKVTPYYFTWTTYAKGRWLGRTLEDIFRDEFFAVNKDVTEARISADSVNIYVNGIRTQLTHKIKNNDYIANYTHRHECPVTARPLKIVAETDDMLVIDKPASIPCHPCGRFRMNSVIYILASEFGRRNLRVAHRLDRLTSGLLIFAKNLSAAQSVHDQITERVVRKEYLAQVHGRFPTETVLCNEPIDCVNPRAGIYQVRDTGRPCTTEFHSLYYDEAKNTSIVKCKPLTGRTHQIRIHLQYIGFPIVNDPVYGANALYTGKDKIDPVGNDILTDFPEECQRTKHFKLDKLPDDPWVDPKCPECWVKFEDPKDEYQRIDLHAWKYQGPGWKFETELPFWARHISPSLISEPSEACIVSLPVKTESQETFQLGSATHP